MPPKIGTIRKKSKLLVPQKAVVDKTNGHKVDWEALLGAPSNKKSILEYGANRKIFWQGQPADSLFYLRRG